ncbi:hypothetical protein SEA_LILHUDDY_61 [Arthrobacter phage LilHuddy]|nr:hypothetical protein SEA_LILHUDDY_61 [Arthrobacter phage LilHuddy]
MKRHLELLISQKIFPALRLFIYRRGLRPKRGSIFYSASLEAMFILKKFLRSSKRK